jgi:protein-disulfide isomerase
MIQSLVVLPSFLFLDCKIGYGQSETLGELKGIRKSIDALRDEQKTLRKGLEEIKSILLGRQLGQDPPQSLVLSLDDDPFKGEKTAKLTLVEFSDYQCPFCARAFQETLPQLQKEYILTGKLKYVFRDFPLPIHKDAPKAAEAANCAGEQKKYWEMHDRLFGNQNALGMEELPKHAQILGLDLPAFQKCLDGGRQSAEIRKDIQDGIAAGVTGTPSFFLGFTDQSNHKMKVQKQITGAQPYAAFKTAIDGLLESQK